MSRGPESAPGLPALDESRPLIVCDADEVLVRFVEGLEHYLETQGLRLDLRSFALTGNIRERPGGRALEQAEVSDLLRHFYETRTEHLAPVPGAAEALAALSGRCQIVILSNLPGHCRAARAAWCARHGMGFPVVANAGPKGRALKDMAARSGRPVFFLDDIPHHIADAAAQLPEGLFIHFVADPRLAALLPPSEHCHLRTGDWMQARAFIEERLGPPRGRDARAPTP